MGTPSANFLAREIQLDGRRGPPPQGFRHWARRRDAA